MIFSDKMNKKEKLVDRLGIPSNFCQNCLSVPGPVPSVLMQNEITVISRALNQAKLAVHA